MGCTEVDGEHDVIIRSKPFIASELQGGGGRGLQQLPEGVKIYQS